MKFELITEESFIGQLDIKEIDERTQFYLLAIKHIVNTIELNQKELCKLLHDVDTSKFQELIMSRVWTLIDNYIRLYKILGRTPGIKKNTPDFQIFYRKLKKVEDIRHFHQHIDGHLEEMIDKLEPMLGHLTWAHLISDSDDEIMIKV